jgi:hypothetical protein
MAKGNQLDTMVRACSMHGRDEKYAALRISFRKYKVKRLYRKYRDK